MTMIVKAKAETDDTYGCNPYERPIEEHLSKGVINLDKPSGPTSHEIDAWVKRILHIEKTGHGGTLDPKVTGVLPIGIDSATRVIQLLLEAPKEYVCLMRIHKGVGDAKIRQVFEEFHGKIFQTPPLKSAVKRELRVREIYSNNILEIQDQFVLFKIQCEAGTYVRTYCYDIGEALGTGAHMAELRRTQAGPFTEKKNLVTLQDVTDAYYYLKEENDESYIRKVVMPMEKVTESMPKVIIRDSAVDAISHGANLAVGGILSFSEDIKKDTTVAIKTLKGELVAAAKSTMFADEIEKADSGFVFTPNRVFMKEGTYPMMWK
ncbi:MAG: RNA-guided pseudouridylation complex pseudouridine synthase subunit Cbf5 [Methanobacteriaceae archaeon]